MLDVDLDRERISLSLKATQQDPWQEFATTHRVGELVYGRVTKLVPFGAFVQVGEGIEGLVHISEMSAHHVDLPEQVVTPGEELWVKIIDLDLQRRRISLSIKQAAEGGVVAAEYQEHFGEHAYDDEGNYIGPALEHSEEAEEAWAEYYTEDPDRRRRAAGRDAEAPRPPSRRARRRDRWPTSRTPARSTKPDSSPQRAAGVPEIRAKGRTKVPADPAEGPISREEVGVSSRRTLILIAAVLVGAVAAFALWTYVGGIEDEANDNAERVRDLQDRPGHPEGHLRRRGLRPGLHRAGRDRRRSTARPPRSPSPSQIDGLVAISDLAANQVVVDEPVRHPAGLAVHLLAAPEEQRGGHHDLGRPGARRRRPARARGLREHPGHRRRGRATARAPASGQGGGRRLHASRRATCTRRCRSSRSADPQARARRDGGHQRRRHPGRHDDARA